MAPAANNVEPMVSATYVRPAGFAAAGDTIPFLLDNTYHLFHLASPLNTVYHPPRVRCSWIRQRSKDLVHWTRDTKPVISPGAQDSDPDCSGAWTGSVVLGRDGNMHIFYTGYNLPEGGGRQVILHAVSSDREGTEFEKPLQPIQLDSASANSYAQFEATDFRDPYVFFNEEENCYWMVVATRLAAESNPGAPYWTRGCLALLTSADLDVWMVQREPLYAPNNILCPECPEMFTLGNGKWYIVYSRFSAPDAGTLYVVSDSGPRGPYRSPRDGTGGRLDGRRWYAAKSCPKRGDPSKRIFFAWVHDRHQDADISGKWLWGGSLMQPRELRANANGSLVLAPNDSFLGSLRDVQLSGETLPAEVTLGTVGVQSVHRLSVVDLPADDTIQVLSFTMHGVPDMSSGNKSGCHNVHPDAKSFGLLLNFDDDLRGYKLSFAPVGGGSAGLFSVALVTDQPPLDDFWAMLTKHTDIPNLVDGPELVRHGAVHLDSEEPLRLVRNQDVIELFVDGKVITYRLPAREQKVNETDGVNRHAMVKVYPVGFFVEDGEVSFKDIRLSQVTITDK
ncbi:hypothetical protein Sste5346_009548 [Sporothrix stenoceras]|uniref:beta-fructofuranosidase n=1 Tax=Sporothrix stenoceras TaxID=5173 RepID=A0ABR3YKW2_9PEZI